MTLVLGRRQDEVEVERAVDGAERESEGRRRRQGAEGYRGPGVLGGPGALVRAVGAGALAGPPARPVTPPRFGNTSGVVLPSSGATRR